MRLALLALIAAFGVGCSGKGKSTTPEILASDSGNFLRIRVNASGVYWTVAAGSGEGRLVSVPVGGGAMRNVVTKLISPRSIALDDTSVYFTDQRDSGDSLFKVDRSGGDAVELVGALKVGQKQHFSSLLAFSSDVYFTDDEFGAMNGGIVGSVPIMGGDTTTLAMGQGSPGGLAADTLSVYWANAQTGSVEKLDEKLSRKITDLATDQAAPSDVGIDVLGGVAYWSTVGGVGADGAIMQVTTTVGGTMGGTPTAVATGLKLAASGAISVDGSGVYWIEFDSTQYAVRYVQLTGGDPSTLAMGPASAVYDITTYGDKVYWLDSDGQKSYVHWIEK